MIVSNKKEEAYLHATSIMSYDNYKIMKASGQPVGAKERYKKAMKDVETCPYCGSATTLREPEYVYKKPIRGPQKIKLFVCNNFPECNVYAKATLQGIDGEMKWVPQSSLANAKLRALRAEAHHYEKMVIDFGIFKKTTDFYMWLSDKMCMTRVQCHFGRLHEGHLRMAIDLLVEILKQNQFRYPNKKISAFKGDNPYKTQAMLDKIFVEGDEDAYDE